MELELLHSATVQSLLGNLRYSLRALRQHPGFTATVLLTVALGVGANTAVFTLDYASLLAPLPYPQPQQLVMVWSEAKSEREQVSPGDFLEWRRQSTAFQELNAWTSSSFNLATQDQPENVDGRITTPGLYRMLGMSFFLGRDFLPEEGQPGRNHEVILTHKLWMRLGSDSKILGKALRLDDAAYTVVGVLPAGLFDRGQGELVVPLAFTPEQLNHQDRWLAVMGRLKPGINIQQAAAAMNAVASRLAQTFPKSNTGVSARVEPLKNDFLPPERISTLWLLLGAVGFVLLIACVNVANLLLARSISRHKEFAVRSSLGANARVIFSQLLTESLMLATLGGLLGVGVGYAMLGGLLALVPRDTLPSEANFHLNLPVLLFSLITTSLAGLLFGCAPAWYASRVDPAEALKQGGRSGTGAAQSIFRRTLVVGEFALALTLLTGGGLAIHSFYKLLHLDLGVRTEDVLTFDLNLPDSRSKDPDRILAYYRQMLSQITSLPGVLSASAGSGVPLQGPGFGMRFSLAGSADSGDETRWPSAGFGMATPEYFHTFGIRLTRGRAFTEQDNASGLPVAMVNEELARRFLDGRDPIGRQIVVQQPGPDGSRTEQTVVRQIVGVFHNVRYRDGRGIIPEIQIPFAQAPERSASIGVRTAHDPLAMMPAIAGAVHAVDPQIAVAEPRSMRQVRDDVFASDRFLAVLFSTFSAVGLLLAGVGIYGVMTFSVGQRSREIALRIALGATKGGVLTLILREGLLLSLIGSALGLLGGLTTEWSMRGLLFGTGAVDFSVFCGVATLLLVSALIASYLPAQRAASTDPMQVLRNE